MILNKITFLTASKIVCIFLVPILNFQAKKKLLKLNYCNTPKRNCMNGW